MDCASTLCLSCSPDPDCGRQWNHQEEVEVGKERKSGLQPSPFCSITDSLGQNLKSQVYSQLSSSLGMGWSHKGGARRPEAFHPIPTDPTQEHSTTEQKECRVNPPHLDHQFSCCSCCCHQSSEASLCPALPPQIPPRPADETQEGAEGCSCGEGWKERGRETFRRSDHLEAPLKGPAASPGLQSRCL